MKKIISVLLCLFLFASMLSACSLSDTETATTESENPQAEIETVETESVSTEKGAPGADETVTPDEATPIEDDEVTESGENGDSAGAETPDTESVIGQTVTFRNLDITFNSAEVVKAKGNVLALNVTIVNNGGEAVCIGAARTTLTDSTGERKSTYGFDVDDMAYITDTAVAPGETLEGYLIYYAPDSSPATLTMDNSYDNEGEILNLVVAFEPLG